MVAGAFASARITSNATADFSMATRGAGGVTAGPRFLETNQHDSWIEAGATLSSSVGRNVAIEGFLSRSFGERVGNAVHAGVGLRLTL